MPNKDPVRELLDAMYDLLETYWDKFIEIPDGQETPRAFVLDLLETWNGVVNAHDPLETDTGEMTRADIAIKVEKVNPLFAHIKIYQAVEGRIRVPAGQLCIDAECLEDICRRLRPLVVYWQPPDPPDWLVPGYIFYSAIPHGYVLKEKR